MTHPPSRTPDLRVHIPVREPDDAFLFRLASLATASGEAAALSAHGPARWKVALVAASVAAIASGGAALAGALNQTERPAPLGPPTTEVPSDDHPDPTEQGTWPPDEGTQVQKDPRFASGPGSDGPGAPGDEDSPLVPLTSTTLKDDAGDEGAVRDDDDDDDTGDDRDDDTGATADEDESRDDDADDLDDSRDDDDGSDSRASPDGSRDD